MANVTAPFGLKLASVRGAVPNYELQTFKIASGDTTKIFTGDMVKALTTGYGAQWTAATVVSQWLGVFAGCEYLSTAQGKLVRSNYWPGADAAADATGFYYPAMLAAPVQFIIQTDATGAAFADKHANFDVTVGTGSTTTGRSATVLNTAAGAAVTATLPLRLLYLYGTGDLNNISPGNNGTQAGAFNWAVVAANTHQSTGI